MLEAGENRKLLFNEYGVSVWGLFLNNFFLVSLGLSYSIWDLVPQPGIKPMSPALELGVLNTGPPGKSQVSVLQDEKTYGDRWW